MYQTPFADRIRNEVGIRTIAVGAIFEADHVNSIIAAGRADLCAIARPHLANPAWTLHEAAILVAPMRIGLCLILREETSSCATCSGPQRWPPKIGRSSPYAR
jgi:tRNA-dihydrouridine synthase